MCDRTSLDSVPLDPDSDSETGDVAGESYFGGKGLCFRHLVNQIPPIDKLIVPFAGHCAIVRNMKLPGEVHVNDLDQQVFAWWDNVGNLAHIDTPKDRVRCWTVTNECGIQLLKSIAKRSTLETQRALIYLDPPYLMETRKSGPRYKFEMTNQQHHQLLQVAKTLRCKVMISGYWSELYATMLDGWRHFQFETQTRRGMATEHVWCNYDQPQQLQDYSFLGANKRERFKLQRREHNLIAKLKRLPAVERNALLAAVDSHFGGR